jgi:hypothetical protein
VTQLPTNDAGWLDFTAPRGASVAVDVSGP